MLDALLVALLLDLLRGVTCKQWVVWVGVRCKSRGSEGLWQAACAWTLAYCPIAAVLHGVLPHMCTASRRHVYRRVLYHELVLTTKEYMREVMAIDPK